MDQTTSRVLALIRWPLIMCIVAVHMFSTDTLIVNGESVKLEEYDMFNKLWLWVKGFLSENGVATFFFISGFLFFRGEKMSQDIYWSKLKRRFHSLLIPYICWNTIAVLFILGLRFISTRSLNFEFSEIASGYLMQDFSGYPHDAPMWFIRELMLCVLLVPILNFAISKFGWVVVVALGGICFYLYTKDSDYMLLLFSALFFFYFGGCLSIRKINLLVFFGKWKKECFILYPLLGIVYMIVVNWNYKLAMIIKCCNMLIVIALAVNLATYLVKKHNLRANRFLNGAAFFVFAAHVIILYHFKIVLIKIFKPTNDITMILTFIVGYFLLLGFLLGLYYLITIAMPRAASILTGHRAR